MQHLPAALAMACLISRVKAVEMVLLFSKSSAPYHRPHGQNLVIRTSIPTSETTNGDTYIHDGMVSIHRHLYGV
jgi:hypothetical protein